MSEDYKINGSSYDLSKVPKKALEKDDTIKKNKAFDLIFDALDKNKKDAKLDSKELATFFSNLKKADTDKNKDISQRELEAITKELNKQKSGETEIKVADVEGFFSHVMAEASDVEDKDKISVEDALKAEDSDKTDTDTDTDTDSDSDASSGTHSYTVQMDEDYTDIIKRSLKAKGVEEPTEEQIKTEKENFEKNNPGAVKRNKSGVEYLLVGAQVKLEGELENKDNSQEQIDLWVDKYINKKDVSDRVDDPQGENSQSSEIAKKAEEAGYRKTYSPDFFYDEKTKKHMKYNSESGKFEVVPNLIYVDKEENQTYVIQQKGNLKRKEIRDKKGNITSLQALTNSSRKYTNPEYVASKLGLLKTWGSKNGVYYNKATNQHFVWDESEKRFVAKNEIRTMYKDGTYMGTDGKKHSL